MEARIHIFLIEYRLPFLVTITRSDKTKAEISNVRLVRISSFYWSLLHWLLKQIFGEPVAKELAQLALPRDLRFEQLFWTESENQWTVNPRDTLLLMLSATQRRRSLRAVKRALRHRICQVKADPWMCEFRSEFMKQVMSVDKLIQGDGESLSTNILPELNCDLQTLAAEPWRAEKTFPMEILKSPREASRLRRELSSERDAYGQQLVTFLYQLATNPFSLQLPAPRSNDLLFRIAGQRPTPNLTGRDAVRALFQVLKSLGDEATLKDMVNHSMARILRHEFGLSRDRETIPFTDIEAERRATQERGGGEPDNEPWEPEDARSMRGYEEVDLRLQYEALRDRLPPKQRDALDIYLEHFDSGEPIDSICRRRSLNPVTVRNNFQAIKRRLSTEKS